LLVALTSGYCHLVSILTELYIEALLVDESLANEVWALWDQGLISDDEVGWTWSCITLQPEAIVHCLMPSKT
jgi:hypothetical protein